MGKSKEYVENWLLAAQPEHPMIVRWKDRILCLPCGNWNQVHYKMAPQEAVVNGDIFNSYWNSLHGGWEQACLPKHPMFAHIDLSHMHRFGHDMRSYLVMHSCFQKMIHEEPEMRRIWQEEMLLFKAEEGALWHLEEVDWTVDKAMQKWLGPRNQAWEKYVVTHCPVLKFTRAFAECLDRQPRWKFVNRDDVSIQVAWSQDGPGRDPHRKHRKHVQAQKIGRLSVLEGLCQESEDWVKTCWPGMPGIWKQRKFEWGIRVAT
eukprot:symbB.v1.2.039971.t2/scaffold6908.1/size14682/1